MRNRHLYDYRKTGAMLESGRGFGRFIKQHVYGFKKHEHEKRHEHEHREHEHHEHKGGALISNNIVPAFRSNMNKSIQPLRFKTT